jgi:hypothetical protein
MQKNQQSETPEKQEVLKPQYEFQESYKSVKGKKDRDFKKRRNKSKFDRFR